MFRPLVVMLLAIGWACAAQLPSIEINLGVLDGLRYIPPLLVESNIAKLASAPKEYKSPSNNVNDGSDKGIKAKKKPQLLSSHKESVSVEDGDHKNIKSKMKGDVNNTPSKKAEVKSNQSAKVTEKKNKVAKSTEGEQLVENSNKLVHDQELNIKKDASIDHDTVLVQKEKSDKGVGRYVFSGKKKQQPKATLDDEELPNTTSKLVEKEAEGHQDTSEEISPDDMLVGGQSSGEVQQDANDGMLHERVLNIEEDKGYQVEGDISANDQDQSLELMIDEEGVLVDDSDNAGPGLFAQIKDYIMSFLDDKNTSYDNKDMVDGSVPSAEYYDDGQAATDSTKNLLVENQQVDMVAADIMDNNDNQNNDVVVAIDGDIDDKAASLDFPDPELMEIEGGGELDQDNNLSHHAANNQDKKDDMQLNDIQGLVVEKEQVPNQSPVKDSKPGVVDNSMIHPEVKAQDEINLTVEEYVSSEEGRRVLPIALHFNKGEFSLNEHHYDKISMLTQIINIRSGDVLQIVSYATGDGKTVEQREEVGRKIALQRVIAIRKALIDRGVDSALLKIQALSEIERDNKGFSDGVEFFVLHHSSDVEH